MPHKSVSFIDKNSTEGRMMEQREFDLNIEKVLENWKVSFAIREIIANAIDEQVLTNTSDIQIYQDENECWHIRDYGRGLKHTHFTQNENAEKLSHPGLIGKFGVGLKDALATFNRHGVEVAIDSKFGHFTIGQAVKYGFDDITTLHVYIADPDSPTMEGTDFCINGCTEKDIEDAKDCFLRFTELQCLETTEFGQIYSKRNNRSEIFINGIKVAEEDNFLFSYNITSINSSIKKALNRERTNVGRSAYTSRIKDILLCAKTDKVINDLTEDLTKMSYGNQSDELKWVDVQTYAVKVLSSRKNTVFVTHEDIVNSSGHRQEILQESGKTQVLIPASVKTRIEGARDNNGNIISTIKTVISDYNRSREYEFVPVESLDESEKENYDLVQPVLSLLNSKITIDRVFIAESLKPDGFGYDLDGVYERGQDRVIIKRNQLSDTEVFLGTLIHELVHADSGAADISRSFENALTRVIGILAARVINDGKAALPKEAPKQNNSVDNKDQGSKIRNKGFKITSSLNLATERTCSVCGETDNVFNFSTKTTDPNPICNKCVLKGNLEPSDLKRLYYCPKCHTPVTSKNKEMTCRSTIKCGWHAEYSELTKK